LPSFLEQLLGLFPATSIDPKGSPLMNDRVALRRNPLLTTKDYSTSWAFLMPEKAHRQAAEAVENMPESENVDDRRVSDKNLKGYRKLINSLDKEGYTQFPSEQAFLRRPTAAEMRMLRSSGEAK
jgi:hypothetical protein